MPLYKKKAGAVSTAIPKLQITKKRVSFGQIFYAFGEGHLRAFFSPILPENGKIFDLIITNCR